MTSYSLKGRHQSEWPLFRCNYISIYQKLLIRPSALALLASISQQGVLCAVPRPQRPRRFPSVNWSPSAADGVQMPPCLPFPAQRRAADSLLTYSSRARQTARCVSADSRSVCRLAKSRTNSRFVC